MLIEVYDIETLSNLFTYTGFDATNKQWYQFVISKWRNNIELLYSHLFRDKMWMCGYNNESFDYPVIHHLINHYGEYKDLDGEEILDANKVQQQIKLKTSLNLKVGDILRKKI